MQAQTTLTGTGRTGDIETVNVHLARIDNTLRNLTNAQEAHADILHIGDSVIAANPITGSATIVTENNDGTFTITRRPPTGGNTPAHIDTTVTVLRDAALAEVEEKLGNLYSDD